MLQEEAKGRQASDMSSVEILRHKNALDRLLDLQGMPDYQQWLLYALVVGRVRDAVRDIDKFAFAEESEGLGIVLAGPERSGKALVTELVVAHVVEAAALERARQDADGARSGSTYTVAAAAAAAVAATAPKLPKRFVCLPTETFEPALWMERCLGMDALCLNNVKSDSKTVAAARVLAVLNHETWNVYDRRARVTAVVKLAPLIFVTSDLHGSASGGPSGSDDKQEVPTATTRTHNGEGGDDGSDGGGKQQQARGSLGSLGSRLCPTLPAEWLSDLNLCARLVVFALPKDLTRSEYATLEAEMVQDLSLIVAKGSLALEQLLTTMRTENVATVKQLLSDNLLIGRVGGHDDGVPLQSAATATVRPMDTLASSTVLEQDDLDLFDFSDDSDDNNIVINIKQDDQEPGAAPGIGSGSGSGACEEQPS